MFWKKTDNKRLDDGDRAKDDGGSTSSCNNDEAKSSSHQTIPNHEQQTTPIQLPPLSLSPSKRSVHIMNITSGLCADPIHLHSFTSVSSNGWVPSPTSFFVGAFHKCGACHGRLGGSASTIANDITKNGEEEGGGVSSCCTSNDIMHSSSTSSSGMLHCVACGIYAHRTCAFASRGNTNNSSSRSSTLLPVCEVNLIEIQKAFGLSREQIIEQMGIYSKQPQSNTANTETGSRSSSWSIFGKRSLTDAEQQAIIKDNEEKILQEREDAIIPKKEEQSTSIQQQQPGVIQTSLNLIQKTTDTSKNIPRASAIGLVAGGAAGLVIAGPAGVVVGSQIGRTVLAVGAAVEGGIGIGVLVMSLAAAANYSPNFTLPSSASSKEKERELKLSSTLILVRPDIAVDPIWGEYAKEARELWGQKYHNDHLSSSSNQFSLGNLFNSNGSASDERGMRYRKDSDIVKADSSELALREKVFLLVNRILNDKTSLPGYQYRYLILKHKRRTMFGADEDDTATDKSAEKDESTEQRSCRQDAHGVIKHVTATLLEVRPGLASSPNMTELTASAVEVLIFGELYDDCFGEIIKETEDRDESLLAKVKELQMICDGDDSSNDTLRVDGGKNNDEISSSVSQLAIGALQALPQAHTPTDKLLHCVEFLEYVSEHFSSSFQGKCIDADTLLIMVCQHVVAANIKHLHAEVAFIEEFSRDEQLLSGKEGYALITLQASLHYLDGVDEFCSILSPKILAKGDNNERR